MQIQTDNDGQHQDLARGAVHYAERALAEDRTLNDLLTTDVVEEAGLAWLATGLLPSALPKWEQDEICAAIAGRVATVLVMVGWQPPGRLLDEVTEAGRARSVTPAPQRACPTNPEGAARA